MFKIVKIAKVNSENYEIDSGRQSDPFGVIKYIVIGMTNSTHSGYAYANSYTKKLPDPLFSFHYIVDRNGQIYQTIADDNVAFAIKSAGSSDRTDNVDVLSICLTPTWSGDGYGDEYERYSQFPTYPSNGDQFILTKARTVSGEKYPIGLYEYDGEEWQLIEEMSAEEVKRPYNSNNWSFESETIDACLHLVNWLKSKYEINDARVLRTYDFNKMYSPFVTNEYEWQNFKSDLSEIDGQIEKIVVTNKEEIDIKDEIAEANPDMSVAEIIETFGPDAGNYDYKCSRPDACPYRGVVMYDELCTLSGLADDVAYQVRNCPYRKIQPKNTKYSGNANVNTLTLPDPSKANFKLGINNKKDKQWDVEEAVDKCQYTTYIDGTIGEMSFTLLNEKNLVSVKEGANVGLWINSTPEFNGNIFEIKQKMKTKEFLDITCYGAMKYLQCDGFKTFRNKTASQIFDEVCNMVRVPHKIVDEATYVCTSKNNFGDSWYTAIENAIVETLAKTGRWYIIQDNFGTLEFREIINQDNVRSIKFSEDSCLIDGTFTSDINDSYNSVVGYISGDGSGEVAAHAEAKDESTITEWGLLTKVEQVSKNNSGALQDWVNRRLKFWNSPRRHFKLSCLGVPGVTAGNIIWLEIYNVVSVGNIAGGVIVDKCTHNIEKSKHTMDLEVEIVQDGTIMANVTSAIQKIQAQNTPSAIIGPGVTIGV